MSVQDDRSRMRDNEDEPLFSLGEAPLDRMPALGLLFEAAARACQRYLGEHIDELITISYDKLEARRISDFMASLAEGPEPFIFFSPELKAKAAVFVTNDFNESVLEALLGSGVVESRGEISGKHSRIERRLIEFSVEKIFDGLTSALAAIATIRFYPDPSETEQGLVSLGAKGAVLIMAYFRLNIRDEAYSFSIALPRAALDPFRPALSRMPGLDGRIDDTRWTDDLYQQIVRTEIPINVRIEAHGFTLDDISQLEVGDLLRLPVAPTSPIRVETEGQTLFWCTLGQKDGYFTVRLEEVSDARQTFIENLLGV
jgi:flagellar motor switch protein FliM